MTVCVPPAESSWKDAFDYVKSCRASCAPNTGFTCNLIEIGDMLMGESRHSPIFFRCASHLPRDPHTPVLKLVRSEDSRKIILPRSSVLHSDGVFVVRPAAGDSKLLFVWKGRNASAECLQVVCILAQQMMGVYCDANVIELVDDGAEPVEFLEHLIIDDDKDARNRYHFDDLLVCGEEAVTKAKRRRSIGSATTLRKAAQTATAVSLSLHLEDAEGEGEAAHLPEQEAGGEPLGGDKIVVGGHVTRGFMDVLPVPALRATPKTSIVLKHTLSMEKSSDCSVTVERPAIRNLTSTNLADSALALKNEKPAEAPVVSAESAAPALTEEKVKPRLFLCSAEDRDDCQCQWQACVVYDDDDLAEVPLPSTYLSH